MIVNYWRNRVTNEEAERILRVGGLIPTPDKVALVRSVYDIGYAKGVYQGYDRGYTKANLDAVDRGEMKW